MPLGAHSIQDKRRFVGLDCLTPDAGYISLVPPRMTESAQGSVNGHTVRTENVQVLQQRVEMVLNMAQGNGVSGTWFQDAVGYLHSICVADAPWAYVAQGQLRSLDVGSAWEPVVGELRTAVRAALDYLQHRRYVLSKLSNRNRSPLRT